MTPHTHELLERALKLSRKERGVLIRELILSLDEDEADDPAEIERAWSKEIARRLRYFDAGRVKTIPAEQVFAKLRAVPAKARGKRKTRSKRRP
ncbi:MAG: addiction module protein [Planctomycetota bacterium]